MDDPNTSVIDLTKIEPGYIDLTVESPKRTQQDNDVIFVAAIPSTSSSTNRATAPKARRKRPAANDASSALTVDPIYDLPEIVIPSVPTPPKVSSPPQASKISTCKICLDDYGSIEKKNVRMVSTSCGHVFCQPCIQLSLQTKKECPVCRKKLTPRGYHPIFL